MDNQPPAARLPGPSSLSWLLATRGAEGFADSLARTLLPILAVSVLGLGTAYVGVLNSLSLATFLLLGIPIGSLIDGLGRRTRAMAVASLTRAFCLVSIAILYLTQTLSGPALLVAALLVGIADVAYTTAEGTVVPALVPESELKTAYSHLAVTSQSAMTGASLVGSLLLSIAGVLGMVVTAIVSYTTSLVFQRQIAVEHEPTRIQTRSARDGFQILFASKALRSLTVSAALTNAGVMLGNTMLPVLVLRDLAISPAVFAAMGVVAAVGAILGSAVAPLLTTRIGLRRIRICSAVLAGPAVLFAVYCQELPSHEVIWLMLQAFLWNLLVSISSVAGSDVLPRVAPRHRLASVGAAQRTITLGIMPISALIGGAVGAYTGTTAMIWVWAGLAVLAALPLLRVSELDQF